MDQRPGDLWLRLRSRPGADPRSEVARLKKLIKRLGRAHGFLVWWLDVPPAGAVVREETDGKER